MENYINVICRTNLDYYDCSVITKMSCRPIIGDYVSVFHNGQPESLKIVSITHGEVKSNEQYTSAVPGLIIELHK